MISNSVSFEDSLEIIKQGEQFCVFDVVECCEYLLIPFQFQNFQELLSQNTLRESISQLLEFKKIELKEDFLNSETGAPSEDTHTKTESVTSSPTLDEEPVASSEETPIKTESVTSSPTLDEEPVASSTSLDSSFFSHPTSKKFYKSLKDCTIKDSLKLEKSHSKLSGLDQSALFKKLRDLRKLKKFLEEKGLRIVDEGARHSIWGFEGEDDRSIIIPRHPGQDLSPGVREKIIKKVLSKTA